MLNTLVALCASACLIVATANDRRPVPDAPVDLLMVSHELIGPLSDDARIAWTKVLSQASNKFDKRYALYSSSSGRSLVACKTGPESYNGEVLLWKDWRAEPEVLSKYSQARFLSDSYLAVRTVGLESVGRVIDIRQPSVPIILPPEVAGAWIGRLHILDDGRWIGVSKKGVLVGKRENNVLVVEHEIDLGGSPQSIGWTKGSMLLFANMATPDLQNPDEKSDYRTVIISSERAEVLYELTNFHLHARFQLPGDRALAMSEKNRKLYLITLAEAVESREVRPANFPSQRQGPFLVSPSGAFVLGREAAFPDSYVIGGGGRLVVRTITGSKADKAFTIPKNVRHSSQSGWLVWSDS